MTKMRTPKSTLPSLSSMARLVNPLDDAETLLQRLMVETAESRHLEWKLTPPFGSAVTTKIRYRMVKALVSFANTSTYIYKRFFHILTKYFFSIFSWTHNMI